MGRMKARGSASDLNRAGGTDPGTFKQYDGPTPPRGVYRLKLRPNTMTTKLNKNNDPWISMLAAIDEPAKKGNRTNPKAQYNGALVRGSINMSPDNPQFFNAMLASFGVPKAQWKNIWKTGFPTKSRPGKDDLVASFGKRTLEQMCADNFFGVVDLEIGGKKPGGGKYPDKLTVMSFLTPSDIVSSPEDAGVDDDEEGGEDDDEDDAEDDEDADEGEDEEDEGEDDEGDEDDAVEERQAELEGMTRADLRLLVKKLDPTFRVTAKVTDEELVEAILDLEFPEEEDGEDEPEPEAEDEEVDDDADEDEEGGDMFDGLDRSQLKAYIAKNKIDIKVNRGMSDDDVRDAIRDAEGEPPEEEEEEAPPPPKTRPKAAGRRRSAGADEPPF